ncbi:alpha/beta fold hydrolase [Propionivibrio sp.]|uniref:alpha/beta fold hydrolase n=1 Tax=Propionivibrio sp. TaxID=2212460 RepID=UPI003BF0F81F
MTPWIFLRGLTRESRHWGSFPETFRREVPDAQVYTPDLPGNGTLNAQESPLYVQEMAECIRAQLIGQGIPPPYNVLAMSLGAMAAVAWAKGHPEEIRGAVLINTSMRPFSPFYRRLKPGNYSRLLKLALLGGSDQDWESAILARTSHHPEHPAEVLKNWVSYRREYPVSGRNALRQLLAAARYRGPLDGLVHPVLILTSQLDDLVDNSCSRQLADRWKTAFAEHPTAGHDLPLDDGPWVASQVGQWLRTLPANTQQS